MADIIHCVRVNAPPADVRRAVRNESLLASFWPKEELLGTRVVAVEDPTGVAWHCLEGPAEWNGTDIHFDVEGEGPATLIRLRHKNWREMTDFMGMCATSWARVLLGLKVHLETPEPDDVLM